MSNLDAFDSAANAGNRSSLLYAKIEISADFIIFPGGNGRPVLYDSTMHNEDQRRTRLSIIAIPIDEHNYSNMTTRDIIAESKEWGGIVWPSMKEVGITNPREIHNKYVKVEMAKSGRTWKNRSGDTVEGTTFKFHKMFDSKEECVKAFYTDNNATPEPRDPAKDIDMNKSDNGSAPPVGNKDTALAFLPALLIEADGDTDKLNELLKTMPIVKEFDWNAGSPEVVALSIK